MSLETLHGHTILVDLLGPKSLVVDLGSNLGNFSQSMIKRFGCRCYAVEALPSLFEKIAASANLKKFNFAVTEKTGTIQFNVSDNPEGNSIKAVTDTAMDTITVPSITLEQFVRDQKLDKIDLLKMDIEGAEIEVLNSCSDEFLKGIRQVTIEFHDFNGVISSEEVRKNVLRFQRLGFMSVQISVSSGLDMLFINRKLCGIGFLKSLSIGLFQRWAVIIGLKLKRDIKKIR